MNEAFTASAPGRVCLFGEHQDYLGWPAVVMAIDLRCRIRFSRRDDRRVHWSSPALELQGQYDLDRLPASALEHGQRNDHMMAALIEGGRAGWTWPCGWNALIESEIPVQAGCSSSTALISAWILGLAKMAGHALSPSALVQASHRAEVLHFEEPGGQMDHQAIAYGGLNRVHADGEINALSLEGLGVFLLGDSGVPKNTLAVLTRCKTDRLELLNRMGGHWDGELPGGATAIQDADLLKSTLLNKQIEEEASAALSGDMCSASTRSALGKMMDVHHSMLAEHLGVSTVKIDAMCRAGRIAGALGAKINGSGGGGCMLAWLHPEDRDTKRATLLSLERAGAARVVQVRPDSGAKID